jgi:hypothetical protein
VAGARNLHPQCSKHYSGTHPPSTVGQPTQQTLEGKPFSRCAITCRLRSTTSNRGYVTLVFYWPAAPRIRNHWLFLHVGCTASSLGRIAIFCSFIERGGLTARSCKAGTLDTHRNGDHVGGGGLLYSPWRQCPNFYTTETLSNSPDCVMNTSATLSCPL